MKLAGINTADGVLSKPSSPAGKGKVSLSQHTAHGLHGPAHATASRALSGKIEPTRSTTHANTSDPKSGIGRYDGGFETDAEGKEVVTGDAAKILEMQSA